MSIKNLLILPSVAIGRLGSADEPLDNYIIEKDRERPLDFRRIKRAETFIVDTSTGKITEKLPPDDNPPLFKDDGRVRPVAPFIEAFATFDQGGKENLIQLTGKLLKQLGLKARWQVRAANFKVFRRTGDENDKVKGGIDEIEDHQLYTLKGSAQNFVCDGDGEFKTVRWGTMQFIQPTDEFNEIRLRFTPAAGLIYGCTPLADSPDQHKRQQVAGPAYSDIEIPPERTVYDSVKGTFNGHVDENPTLTTYGQGLYAAYNKTPFYNYYDSPQPARGYLDDTCDGIVTLALLDASGKVCFSSKARFSAAPPVYAPDSEFIRTIEDEMEQVLLGPAIDDDDNVPMEQAEDIVRRAYETVRFMNLSVLNGDTVKGRPNVADTMVANDCEDLGRSNNPIMAEHTIDTLSISALHQQLYTSLRAGAAPWFYELMRQPNEVGDLTDKGRRKMPAMMSGAEGRYLTLTYRQLDVLKQAGSGAIFDGPMMAKSADLTPRNLTAQLQYRGEGNPLSTHIGSAAGNCCPGLEFDFRAVWRRVFEGITLVEHNNYVVQAEGEHSHLQGHRLVAIDIPDAQGNSKIWSTIVQATGPTAYGDSDDILRIEGNPDGVVNLEWSNTLSHIWQHVGKKLTCYFTKNSENPPQPQIWMDLNDPEVLNNETYNTQLSVRNFFEPGSTFINEALAQPGELTQGLCSPWQNDFRECVCYYWATSRPDYVNVEPANSGGSKGDNWLQKKRTGRYVVDDYKDNRLLNYQDLFNDWEYELKFQLQGRDDPEDE
jgi:hypothetical protein